MLVVAALALADDSGDSIAKAPRTPIHIGFVIGFLVWILRFADEQSALFNAQNSAERASQLDTRQSKRPPAPFIRRLAQFMACDEAELKKPRPKPKSKMKFWSLVEFGRWHGPKPAIVIRRILRRIQERVHGAQRRS